MTIYIVFSFYPKIKKANKIAKDVVKKKLAACVNINKKGWFFLCDRVQLEYLFQFNDLKKFQNHLPISLCHSVECLIFKRQRE